MRLQYFICLFIFTLIIQSCVRNEVEPGDEGSEEDFENIAIADDFDYATSQDVEVIINDGNQGVRYDIYTLEADTSNLQLASGTPFQGVFRTKLTIPTSTSQLYLIRNQAGNFNTQIVDINGGRAEFTFDQGRGTKSSKNDCTEKLYAVNGNGQFYRIDNESGNYEEEQLSDLAGGGSIACAVDRANRKCYYNTGTTLRYYDIDAGTFHVVSTGNPFNGSYPRMEYDNTSGLMYIARNEKLYKLDPLTNTVITGYNIIGLQSPVGGGDVAISLDGTMYMCCFSGLYRINIENNQALATRISAENLPFQPTSMAIDRSDRLYLATNDANSQLIEMDKFDGSWTVRKTYNHKINDLGSLPCTTEELEQRDTDNDGIIDQLDDHPEDSTKAFNTYTPSKLGWGSLGFEDLWPSKGDFDFNDLVVNYRFTAIANTANEVVELECKFIVKNIGASLSNGFGFELPISQDLIASVTGFNHTEGILQLNPNGTEANQSKAVIIVFDNAYENGNWGECAAPGDEMTIRITFNNPVDQNLLGNAPFNPFIFVDRVRGHEIHMADYTPTDLADTSIFGTLDDRTDANSSIYYKDELNHPWAINIIHNFRVPRERAKVYNAYKRFKDWAQSRGSNFKDWYKDNSGYRNTTHLCDN